MGRYLDLHDVAFDHPVAMEELNEYRKVEGELEVMAKLLKCNIFEVSAKMSLVLENIKKLEGERDRLIKLLNEEGKMHTDHKVKEEGVITMVVVAGAFIIGKMIGGNKLTDPRIFSIIDNGQRMQMSPLPGEPPFIVLTGADGFRYTVPDVPGNKGVLELYDRVTHPQSNIVVPSGRPTLVTPDITGKMN